MEEEHNWELILKVAAPIALIEAYVFYANISNFWKWFSLAVGLISAGAFVYIKDRRKGNIFTAISIVFLVALVVMLLRGFGVI